MPSVSPCRNLHRNSIAGLPPLRTVGDSVAGARGYAAQGKGNIFAVEPSTVYLSSPERDARAKQGLGSPQTVAAIALTVGALGFATVNGVLMTPEVTPDSLLPGRQLSQCAGRHQGQQGSLLRCVLDLWARQVTVEAWETEALQPLSYWLSNL
jgi:hypothetical protein